MEVEHLQMMLGPGPLGLDQDRGVLAAATLLVLDREIDVALTHDRMPTEGCVAVAPLLHLVVVTDGEVGVSQSLGDLLRQVKLA